MGTSLNRDSKTRSSKTSPQRNHAGLHVMKSHVWDPAIWGLTNIMAERTKCCGLWSLFIYLYIYIDL